MLRYTGTLTDSLPVPNHRVKLSSDKIRLIVRLLIQEPQQLTRRGMRKFLKRKYL